MKYDIHITSQIVIDIFNEAMTMPHKKHANLFDDMRMLFREKIENKLQQYGILGNHQPSLSYTNIKNGTILEFDPIINRYNESLDINFCEKYGYDDRCINAINYSDEECRLLPSLMSFYKCKKFSIGNFVIPLIKGQYDIDLIFSSGAKSVGYGYQVTPRKLKPSLYVWGVTFSDSIIENSTSHYIGQACKCAGQDLDEIQIGTIAYPIMFICRKCGEIFTCECFRELIDIEQDIIRFLPGSDRGGHLSEKLLDIKYRKNICHLCTRVIPKKQYGSSMYYSSFMQKYLPYHILQSRKTYGVTTYQGDAYRLIENNIRELFGYPKIGERWISETLLYNIVKLLLHPYDVVFHYRGKELQGLEIDIWVPELMLAVEYQGEQHYRAIKHWGGERGLSERVERDKRKKRLCKKEGYYLIEFKYDESLTVEYVEKKLRRFLKKRQ